MSEIRKAKLAFLSQPSRGVYRLNLQFDGSVNLRVEISGTQLGNMIADGAAMAFRHNPVSHETNDAK